MVQQCPEEKNEIKLLTLKIELILFARSHIIVYCNAV